MTSKNWYVYILTNKQNNLFYTGVTNNLQRRLFEHRHSINPNSYTTKYKLFKLVWCEEFHHPDEAIAAEKKIKDYRQEKKLVLIKKTNPFLNDLSESS